MGDSESSTDRCQNHPALSAVSDALGEATGLRAVHRHLRADGSRGTPEHPRAKRDRTIGQPDEPKR